MKSEKKYLRYQAQELLETLWSNSTQPKQGAGVRRRDFLKWSAIAGTGASIAGALSSPAIAHAASNGDTDDAPTRFNEATVAELQAAMASGEITAVELTHFYLRRIRALDQGGPGVNTILEVNPDALDAARAADALRRQGKVLGPLHGIPVLLKGNIDTGDRMQTTAGSFALAGLPAVQDSTVAAKLRAGGAVILGKTNLSEWANFRSNFSSSGWSGIGGQTNSPYATDRNPSGSSSGSAAAASANFTAVSIGTETDGSIVSPANNSGAVAIKPTVGLVSRAGVVPISHIQDTVGPHTRTVADAAAVLSVIASHAFDGRDPATGGVPLGLRGVSSRPSIPNDYTQFLNPNGLSGARIGVARLGIDGASPKTAAIFDAALAAITAAGATLVDVTFPHQADINSGNAESTVLFFDFKQDVQKYFATRVGVPMAGKTLADAIAFNIAHAAEEMPFFGQEIFLLSEQFSTDPNDPNQPFGMSYNAALDADQLFGATEGFDLLLKQNNLDAIVAPTGAPAWTTDLINADHFVFGSSSNAAIVGYPIINVPMGNSFGLPVGISFMGTGFSEPTLIKLASGFEHATKARIVPKFLDNIPREQRNDDDSFTRRRPETQSSKPHHI